MTVSQAIPIAVTPEAAARAAELGMQAELQRMIDHTLQTISGLRRINVVLDPPYDTGDDPYITIEAIKDPATYLLGDPEGRRWGNWKITTFPPEVCQHIALMTIYEVNNAG
jgi:hypothetical protein